MPRTRRAVRGICLELHAFGEVESEGFAPKVVPSVVLVGHPDADLDLMVMPPLRLAPQVLMPVLVVMRGHWLGRDLHGIGSSRGRRCGAEGDAGFPDDCRKRPHG